MEVLDGFEFQIVIEQICSPDNLPITLSVFYRIAGLTICLAVYEARHQPTMGCSPHVGFAAIPAAILGRGHRSPASPASSAA